MSGKDDDIWAAYGRGVKKLKEEPAQKASVSAPPAPQKKNEGPLPPDADLPEAWREKIEQEETKQEKKAEKTEKAPLPVPPPEKTSATKTPPAPQPLDLRIERNLSLGDVVIEARLDLHGKTEQEAHEQLSAFVETQQKRGKRLVLVITGKGREEAPSPLRANVPRWCEVAPLAEKILAVRFAAPHHGGEGAYYVLLKKKGV